MCQMYHLTKPKNVRRRNFFSTFSLFSLAFSLDQVLLAFALNLVVLRRRRGLVLDHGEAKEEEEDVPGLHVASVWLLMADDNVQLNYDFQLSQAVHYSGNKT